MQGDWAPSSRAPGSRGTQPSGPCSVGGPLPSPDFTPTNSLPPPAQTSPIGVFTIPASFADIFLTKSAKLSCLVTNLASYDGLNISWSRVAKVLLAVDQCLRYTSTDNKKTAPGRIKTLR